MKRKDSTNSNRGTVTSVKPRRTPGSSSWSFQRCEKTAPPHGSGPPRRWEQLGAEHAHRRHDVPASSSAVDCGLAVVLTPPSDATARKVTGYSGRFGRNARA